MHHHGKHEQESKPGHSHAKAEIQGGEVAMTKANHFEVVWMPEHVIVYLYDQNQKPLTAKDVTGQVVFKFKDGKEQKTRVRYFRGQMERPATFEDIHRKFNVLAGHVCSKEKLREIAGLVDKLEEMKSAAPLGEALTRL